MMSEKPSVSIRKYIRRGDTPAGETTSTLVLTSSTKRYVDVRVLKPGDRESFPTDPKDPNAAKQLEWAFAGTSESTPVTYDASGKIEKPAHTAWAHWIDSDTIEEVSDEGDMHPQPDGTVLETGVMTNPETGGSMTYEELWQDLDTKEKVCFVLTMEDSARRARGMVIRIGEWIQGIVRVGEKITVERWQFRNEWTKILAIGDAFIPCSSLFYNLNSGDMATMTGIAGTSMEQGRTVIVGSMKWTCIEAFRW